MHIAFQDFVLNIPLIADLDSNTIFNRDWQHFNKYKVINMTTVLWVVFPLELWFYGETGIDEEPTMRRTEITLHLKFFPHK